jgi:hypothetical protein
MDAELGGSQARRSFDFGFLILDWQIGLRQIGWLTPNVGKEK